MEATATLRYLKASPQKVRLVADLIRGKKVEEALNILRFTRKGVREGPGEAAPLGDRQRGEQGKRTSTSTSSSSRRSTSTKGRVRSASSRRRWAGPSAS